MKDAEEFLANLGAVEQPIGPKKVKAYNLPASLIGQIKSAAELEEVSESEMARVALANGMRMHQASKKKRPKESSLPNEAEKIVSVEPVLVPIEGLHIA